MLQTSRHRGGVIGRLGIVIAMLSAVALWDPEAHASERQGQATDSESPVDGHSLLNPVPPALLRPLSTDRPDTTESPYTTDAGHVQLEFSFAEYVRDRAVGLPTTGISLLPTLVKIGLLDNLDLHIGLNPYERRSAGDANTSEGIGDTEVRVRMNLSGNNGGGPGFALMPFVRVPTGSDKVGAGGFEGGLILPLGFQDLPRGFSLGTMAAVDAVRTGEGDRYGVDVVHSVVVGHSLSATPLEGYVEFVGVAPVGRDGRYLTSLGGGVTYPRSPNLQFDAGIVVGLSGQADRITLFAGLSLRR